MLQIGETIISLDVIEKKFCCDLGKCKGRCCVEGDSGAPLADEEVNILEDEFEKIRPFLRPKGIESIEEQGAWVIDSDNDKVTPLIDNKECAYTIIEEGIYKCGIEKAYLLGQTTFRKPISCHLYPIRLKKYQKFTAVNYDIWPICKPAIESGNAKNLSIFEFLKDPLIRRFGHEWYNELLIAKDHISRNPDFSGI